MKTLIIGIAVIALGFFGLVWFKGAPADTTVGIIGDYAAFTKGPSTAKVKITEYADFQCPACAAMAPIVADLLAKYPNDIELTFKHYPLTQIHPRALLAAKASEAAGKQGKFFEMHDKLFTGQSTWSSNSKAEEIFIGYATELGLDVDQFKTDLKDATIAAKIRSNQAEGNKDGVQGTPTFLVNGLKVENGLFVTAVETALK
jgi:protein-disulfide isomerase